MQQTQVFRRVDPAAASTTSVLPQTDPGASSPPPRRRRSGLRRAVTALGVVLALVLGYAAVLLAAGYVGLDRVDAAPTTERPPGAPGHTWLLVGSDSREELTDEQKQELSTGSSDARLTDTILMLTTAPDGVATLISIPRDSLVTIPGYGENRVNAAYAFGGPELLVQTVEQATGVRVDGYVEVGFDGFYRVVEAVGGVEICLDQPMVDERAGIDLPAGCQRLDGADSLGYVRARYSDPNGDFGRVERQREFISALAAEMARPAVLLNPLVAVPLAAAVGDALTVDEESGPVELGRFGLALLRASGEDGQMLTVPFGGYATTDVGSVVLWDAESAEALWSAVRDGTAIPPSALE